MQTRFAIVLLVIGCGGGGVSLGDLPDKIEDAQCDRAVACEGAKDRTTCEGSTAIDTGEFGTIEAGVEDGTIKYDEDKASACIDLLGDTDCDFAGLDQDNPCEEIFIGTVPTGGQCVTDLQCANFGECEFTGTCDPDITCCTGTCAGSVTESALGGPCGDELHVCAANSFCKPPASGSGAGVCTALITTEGGACEAIEACANPMYCNINFTTGDGACKKPAPSGAACSLMDLLPCADSREYCDATTQRCVADAAVGATCGNGVQCVGYASCVNGTCLADIAAGGACTPSDGADCAGSLDCENGICVLPAPGMTCMLP
jgi:hypothetical protein